MPWLRTTSFFLSHRARARLLAAKNCLGPTLSIEIQATKTSNQKRKRQTIVQTYWRYVGMGFNCTQLQMGLTKAPIVVEPTPLV